MIKPYFRCRSASVDTDNSACEKSRCFKHLQNYVLTTVLRCPEQSQKTAKGCLLRKNTNGNQAMPHRNHAKTIPQTQDNIELDQMTLYMKALRNHKVFEEVLTRSLTYIPLRIPRIQ